ncbi:MAG: Fic family protein [Gammaproteobacteria bacterium AqS3]|nr:Fic family protein [Gammaproteobacteria bacterium AqS3]
MQPIWKHENWPNLTWNADSIQNVLYRYAAEVNTMTGRLDGVDQRDKRDSLIDLMVTEAIRTSQIEGEHYDRDDVRSSIRNQLGLARAPEPVRDRRANGISALMISVRETYQTPLTQRRLFEWHDLVMTDPNMRKRVPVGDWRDSDMQVQSGPIGREGVHFIAPPPEAVPGAMDAFIDWFNATAPGGQAEQLPAPIRAAVLHLHFETIHPFADGNGRIGRALSEIALSQELGSPVLLSLSSVIQKRRREYYDELKRASHGDLDITRWVEWFVNIVLQAQLESREMILFVLARARFWKQHGKSLNERQDRTVKRMLREGVGGFTGGMNAKKYMAITECSKATATRDLSALVELGVFRQLPGGGRSTSYELILPEADAPMHPSHPLKSDPAITRI